MDSNANSACSACSATFKRKQGGYNRFRLGVLASQSVIDAIFGNGTQLNCEDYICGECRNVLCRRTIPTRKHSQKRKLPPSFNYDSSTDFTKNHAAALGSAKEHTQHKRSSNMATGLSYLEQYKYVQGFRSLANSSAKAKQALIKVALEIMTGEVRHCH